MAGKGPVTSTAQRDILGGAVLSTVDGLKDISKRKFQQFRQQSGSFIRIFTGICGHVLCQFRGKSGT